MAIEPVYPAGQGRVPFLWSGAHTHADPELSVVVSVPSGQVRVTVVVTVPVDPAAHAPVVVETVPGVQLQTP